MSYTLDQLANDPMFIPIWELIALMDEEDLLSSPVLVGNFYDTDYVFKDL